MMKSGMHWGNQVHKTVDIVGIFAGTGGECVPPDLTGFHSGKKGCDRSGDFVSDGLLAQNG